MINTQRSELCPNRVPFLPSRNRGQGRQLTRKGFVEITKSDKKNIQVQRNLLDNNYDN